MTDEWFWTGWEQPDKRKADTFFIHMAKDKEFSYIARRATKSSTQRPPRTCPIVYIDSVDKLFTPKSKECPVTWKVTSIPKIEGKVMRWSGSRPYTINSRSFLSFKLGKEKGFYLKFHFFSRQARKTHYGASQRVTLLLEDANGIRRISKELKDAEKD